MKKEGRILNVLMNGVLVGNLEKSRTGAMTFVYAKEWMETPGARPISLSLPLSFNLFSGEVVYNFFDNLLPDNLQIRSRIQAVLKIPTSHPFDLLASIGKDCVGAVQLVEGEIPFFKKEILAEPLSENEMASILKDYKNSPLGMQNNRDEFRISIAGAQEKFAFLYHKKKWCKPLGETPTSHIFKLPIGYIAHQNMDLSDSCENEWLCSEIASKFGFTVASCEILKFGDEKILAVERFDRKFSHDAQWLMRLPQEDMCQALGVASNLKYQSDGGPGIKDIMKVLLRSTQSADDRDIFYRAQILFWLLAAIDGHAKNFSIFIEPSGQCRLTPLYDIMSAYPLIAKKELQAQKIKMAMSLKGKNHHYEWQGIQARHFIQTAEFADYPAERAKMILETMLKQVEMVVQTVSSQLPRGFPSYISEPIFEGMRSMGKRLGNSLNA